MPVAARVGVALDEAGLGERPQRARDLALLAADQLRDPDHAERLAARRRVLGEHLDDGEPAPQARGVLDRHQAASVARGRRRAAARIGCPMPDRPAPVTDLAWSAEQAHDLGARVLDLWTELLERLPVAARHPRARAGRRSPPAVALPVPEEPMPVDDLVAHLRELTFEPVAAHGPPRVLRVHLRRGDRARARRPSCSPPGSTRASGGYRLGPGAAEIELHLTRWLAERFGLPEGAGGMIMTGGAMANFVGLKCARDAGARPRRARGGRARRTARWRSTRRPRRTS